MNNNTKQEIHNKILPVFSPPPPSHESKLIRIEEIVKRNETP